MKDVLKAKGSSLTKSMSEFVVRFMWSELGESSCFPSVSGALSKMIGGRLLRFWEDCLKVGLGEKMRCAILE